MDPLSMFLSWQFLLFCVAAFGITSVIRTVVEYIIKRVLKESGLWRDMILPILPVIVGGLMGWILKSFPYPESLANKDFRVVFGISAGLLCTLVYRVIVALINKKAPEELAPIIAKIESVIPVVETTTTTTVSTEVKDPIKE